MQQNTHTGPATERTHKAGEGCSMLSPAAWCWWHLNTAMFALRRVNVYYIYIYVCVCPIYVHIIIYYCLCKRARRHGFETKVLINNVVWNQF